MNSFNITKSKYRADIDGIRALAVLSVFVFHLNPELLPGGFLGVDVFFVISGYLITAILLRENHVQKFSFIHFYARRIKRIFPALFVVLGLSGVVATFLLTPETYVNFMRSGRYASAQLSNFLFAREVGYFEEGFSGQPLLHTWSLGVEEQFYLFWPLLIFIGFYFFSKLSVRHGINDHRIDVVDDDFALAARSMNKKMAGLLFVLASASFAVCYIFAEMYHNLAFYMFYARAWEFCAGGFIALGIVPAPKGKFLNNLSGATGLFLLFVSFFLVKEENLGTSFLQFGVILPCVGAALLIHAGSSQGFANRLLATRLPVYVGKISYSLYLYHWPVIIFWKLFDNSTELALLPSLGIIAVSLVLSVLSYLFVEQPARNTKRSDGQILAAGAIVLVGFVLVFKHMAQYDLASWRISRYASELPVVKHELPEGCSMKIAGKMKYLSCSLVEKKNPPAIALVGDSHAPHFFQASVAWARKEGYDLVFLATPGCPMLLGDVHIKSRIAAAHEKKCEQTLPFFEKYIVNNPRIKLILIAQRFDLFYNGKGYLSNNWSITFKDTEGKIVPNHGQYYREKFGYTVETIREQGKDVIVLKQVPLMKNVKSCDWQPRLKKLFNKDRVCSYDNWFINKWQQPSVDFIDDLTKEYQVNTFDPGLYLNEPHYQGRFLYNDIDHLNQFGQSYLEDSFSDVMDEIKSQVLDK